MQFLRTNSENSGFKFLYPLLDKELKIRDGDDHAFYAQFNKADKIQHVIIALIDDKPVGCGALKMFDADTIEVKRMYVQEVYRGRGIAMKILCELENWAAQLNFKNAILETGIAQPEAISLYVKSGYNIIPNYGQYAGVEKSVCMKKIISTSSSSG